MIYEFIRLHELIEENERNWCWGTFIFNINNQIKKCIPTYQIFVEDLIEFIMLKVYNYIVNNLELQ